MFQWDNRFPIVQEEKTECAKTKVKKKNKKQTRSKAVAAQDMMKKSWVEAESSLCYTLTRLK